MAPDCTFIISKMIRTPVIISLVITLVVGIQYDGLRVKFGMSDALVDVDNFFSIPRTISEVKDKDWQLVERPPGPLPDLMMYCPLGRNICALFSTSGFIAGIMVAIPVDEYDAPPVKPKQKFIKWQAPASKKEPAREYWTNTAYFVSEESLKSGAGPRVENGATLQDGGVWVTDPEGKLMRIPSAEAELKNTPYIKQSCVPKMGTHYYYNMSEDLSCDDFFPWFALVRQGELIGIGFQIVDKVPKQTPRDWFETAPTAKQALQILQASIPYPPTCLLDSVEKYSFVSIHMYFVNDPWNIKCGSEDNSTTSST